MKLRCVLILFLLCIYAVSQEIARGGKSDYVIVTKENPPLVTVSSAEHLQKYMKLVADVDMPIVTARPSGKHAIYIGAHGELPEKDIYRAENYVDDETYRITSLPDGNISIMGADSDADYTKDMKHRYAVYGLLWGTYGFIERFLGVRWYAPDEFGECYEKKDVVTVSGLPVEVTPALYHRNMWPHFFLGFSQKASWEYCRHLRGFGRLNMSSNHSMMGLARFAKDQDEIFALEADGKTRNKGVIKSYRKDGLPVWSKEPQFCFTNPATFKAFCDFIDAVYEKRPGHEYWMRNRPDSKTIVVVPNDNFSYHPCHCKNCQALIDKKAGKSAMTPLVWGFIKKVAEWAKVKYPGKAICTLAYEAYYWPPEFKLPDNIIVQICIRPYIIHQGFPEYMKESDKIVKAWAGIAKELQVWHYVMPYDTVPYAMPHIMYEWHARYPQIKACFLELNNSKMGLPYLPKNVSSSLTYDLPQTHLNLYFAMKAMAGEKMDVDAELELYYKLFWGPAAVPMKRFCETQHKAWENINISSSGVHEYSKRIMTGYKLYEEIYPPEIVKIMNDCFAEAKKLAPEGSIYAKRLDWIYMGYLKAFTENANAYARELNRSNDVVLFNKQGAPVIDGKLDDDFWKGLETYSFQQCAVPLPANFGTTFKMAAANDKLYFGIEAQDPHIGNALLTRTRHDSEVYMDDSIELFFKPGNKEGKRIYNVTINMLGTVLDYRAGDVKLDTSYESGVEVKIVRGEAGYTMELSIPIANLHIPEHGLFGLNIGRNKFSGPGEVHETTAWRCTFAGFWNFENMPSVTLSSKADSFALDYSAHGKADVKMRKNGKLVQDGARYEYKGNAIALYYTMNKENGSGDYGTYGVALNKNKDITGSSIEVRMKNADSRMTHQLVWSYTGEDGKKYADWMHLCKDEKLDEWRVKKIDMRKDGMRARRKMRNKQPPYPDVRKLHSIDIYSKVPHDGVERHAEFDYIRVY